MQPEFFVDRSLGRHQVAHALRAAGWRIVTHHEVFEDRDEWVPDVEWLDHCAAHCRVVLSKDRRLRYKPDEIAAIRRGRLQVFVLARGNLTSSAQAERFVRNGARIEAALVRPGPFVAVVHADGVDMIYP